ncbi:MAG TPA: TlpA disulfide reductase family protein [Luteibacter sp.]|uniref:TlpA family protein disulfide reductase n=1 Tax=Luteibacter sp. TaxID=1886636 RepID=UPI002CBD1DA7|nr:TlpA disulfide reductase family protein [Luteibacter sp.]HVI55344.1 TlpA disulfide reductase family protein [Luteibacter sp.]
MIARFLTAAVVALALAGPVIAAPAATPELKIATLDGKPFNLAEQHGKWVVVNYWATWCVPCIKEMPDISAFVKNHKNVAAIGLAFEDTDAKDIRAFLAKHPVVYPIAQVDVMDPPKAFEPPKGLPTTYLIAPDGTVAKRFVGPVTEQSLGEAIGKGK